MVPYRMLIVSGTKRSGTSLWMQILLAGGFPVIGSAFPGKWGESIRDANPRGFHESLFRQGINWTTNPDPRTGAFVRPEQVAGHAVKVFGPGLVRSDLAYIGKVIVTVRHWREYTASLRRLHALEEAWRATVRTAEPSDDAVGGRDTAGERRVRAGRISPILEWWFQNYELVRDIATRRYPVHVLSYDRLVDDPQREVSAAFAWLGNGDAEAAAAVVAPALRTQRDPVVDHGLPDATIRVFDDYFAAVHAGRGLPAALVTDMNEVYARLVTEWDAERAAIEQQARQEGAAARPVGWL